MLIRVGECEMYSGICACRLSVYVCFCVCGSSDDCEVGEFDVAVGL